MQVVQLPSVIIHYIKEFLIYNPYSSAISAKLRKDGEFDPVNRIEGEMSWRNFLSIMKGENHYWFREIRGRFMDYTLNRYYSHRYLHDSVFRSHVLSIVRDSYQQLSLDLSHSGIETLTDEDGAVLSNIHYLNLSRNRFLRTLPPISHVYEVNASECEITEIEQLSDIKILNVTHCFKLQSIRGLGDLLELHIRECNSLTILDPIPFQIKCLSCHFTSSLENILIQFTKVEDLYISERNGYGRPNPRNIPIPWNLPQLKKLDAERIKIDLSQLNQLHCLEKIGIIQPLGKAKEINDYMNSLLSSEILSRIEAFDLQVDDNIRIKPTVAFQPFLQLKDSTMCCIDQISGYEHLTKLKKISFIECKGLQDTSCFKDYQLVIFNNCEEVSDVSSLGNVRDFIVEKCSKVTNLNGLGKRQRRVEIIRCPAVSDVSMLGNVRQLILDFCTAIEDISALVRVPFLSLRGCTRITNFSGLGMYQKSLNVSGCKITNEHLYQFKDIPDLIISHCRDITDLSMLRNYRLTARSCGRLHSVSLYGNFQKVDLSRSVDLQRVIVYGHIYALALVDISLESTSLITYGSVKMLVSEFEYPNANEMAWIEDDDEQLLYTDENGHYDEEDIDDEGDPEDWDEDGDQWEDVDEDGELDDDDDDDEDHEFDEY